MLKHAKISNILSNAFLLCTSVAQTLSRSLEEFEICIAEKEGNATIVVSLIKRRLKAHNHCTKTTEFFKHTCCL